MNHVSKGNVYSDIQSFFLGLTYAVLTFFLIWIFQPAEIMDGAEYNEIKYIITCITISIILSYVVCSYLIKTGRLNSKINFVSIILILLSSIIFLIVLTSFIADTWEWWITQAGWFIRLHPWAVGCIMGATILYTTIGSAQKIAQSNAGSKDSRVRNLIVIIGSMMGNLSVIHWIFNPFGLFYVILYYVVLSLVVAIVVLYWIVTVTEKEDARRDGEEIQNTEIETRIEKRFTLDVHDKIMLLAIIAQLIVLVALLSDNYGPGDVYVLILPVLIGVLFVHIWSITTKNKRTNLWAAPKNIDSNNLIRSFFKSPFKLIWEQIGIFFMALFELVRLLGPFIMVGFLWYRFVTVFALPNFIVRAGLSALVGIFLFYKTKDRKNAQMIIYIMCTGALLILVFLLNYDVTRNAYSYWGMDFDFFFPFQVLHSTLHVLILGIANGFIFCYEFNRIFHRYSDTSNLAIKSVTMPIIIIAFGIVIVLFGVIGVPGGGIVWSPSFWGYYDDPYVPEPFLEDAYLTPFIVIVVMLGLIPLLDYVVPKLVEKIKQTLVQNLRLKRSLSSEISENKSSKVPEDPRHGGSKTQWNHDFKVHTYHPIQVPLKRKIIVGVLLFSIVPIASVLVYRSIEENLSLQLVESNAAVDVFAAPGNVRIGSNQLITKSSSKVDPIYNISVAANEYESMQFVFRTKGRSLNGLRCYYSAFTHSDGLTTIATNYIQVRYAENRYEDTMPERLVALNAINLIAPRNHIIWITAGAPYGAKTGAYTGTLNFTYGNSEWFAIQLRVNVWNFTLPTMRHMRSNFGPQTANPQMINTFASHRINTYGIPIYSAPDQSAFNSNPIYTCYYNQSTEEWEFHWNWWDSNTEIALSKGLNGFYIDSPLGMPREPVWLESDNVTISEWGILVRKFYEGVQSHLEYKRDIEGKNWFKYAYIYFIDEFQMFVPKGWTHQEYWDALEKFMMLLNDAAPDLKIMTTTPPSHELRQLQDYIDIYCPVSYDYNKTEWEYQKSMGKEIWMYACVGPRAPWPNSHYYNRLYEIRVLYWQVWHYNIHGFLYWSTTPYYHGKYGPGFNAWGDAWYLYEKETGQVDDTIRWENWRDAAEDYEFIWLMNATITAMGGNTAAEELLTGLVSSIVGDTYTYCSNGKIIQEARQIIGDWLSVENSKGIYDINAIGEAEWSPPM